MFVILKKKKKKGLYIVSSYSYPEQFFFVVLNECFLDVQHQRYLDARGFAVLFEYCSYCLKEWFCYVSFAEGYRTHENVFWFCEVADEMESVVG